MSAELYQAASELLGVLATKGSIEMEHPAAARLLWAMDDIDGGIPKADGLPIEESVQVAIVEAGNYCVIAGNQCKDPERRAHLYKTAETIRRLVTPP